MHILQENIKMPIIFKIEFSIEHLHEHNTVSPFGLDNEMLILPPEAKKVFQGLQGDFSPTRS